MKYLVQTGVTPQFITNKLNDVADADDENKAEVRREVTDFCPEDHRGSLRNQILATSESIHRSVKTIFMSIQYHWWCVHSDRESEIICGHGNPQQGWRGIIRWT